MLTLFKRIRILDIIQSPDNCLITIPDDICRQACVYTTEEAIASCQVVCYPVMIKASWGGGGKGIRMVCERGRGMVCEMRSSGVYGMNAGEEWFVNVSHEEEEARESEG